MTHSPNSSCATFLFLPHFDEDVHVNDPKYAIERLLTAVEPESTCTTCDVKVAVNLVTLFAFLKV